MSAEQLLFKGIKQEVSVLSQTQDFKWHPGTTVHGEGVPAALGVHSPRNIYLLFSKYLRDPQNILGSQTTKLEVSF